MDGSARHRAAFNWIILRQLGELLGRVYQADLSKPLPDRLAGLVNQFEERERERTSQPAETP